MLSISSEAIAALRGSHTVAVRATAYTDAGSQGNLPVVSGSVTADATSQVRRSGSCVIGDPTMWPDVAVAPLSPAGSELGIDYGIAIPGREEPEWIPMILGPIQKATTTLPSTQVAVSVSDRSSWVAQDRLDMPGQTVEGALVVAEITRLITESIPTAVVLDLTGNTTVAAVLEIESERWSDGIEKLADSIAAEVYADPLGRFIIRPQPTLDDPPVWLVNAGEGGVMVSADRELTREQVYNAVVARGERTDGTPPVWAKWTDDDPASPTFYGGRFGKRVRYYSSPLLTTVDQCYAAAAALGARAKGMVATIAVEQITNPALEPGDVVIVRLPSGQEQRHIVDALPIPIGTGSQKLTTRTVDALPGESTGA